MNPIMPFDGKCKVKPPHKGAGVRFKETFRQWGSRSDRHKRPGSYPPPPYIRDGTHRPIAGNMYSKTMASTWIAMNGSIPRKI